MLFDKKYIDKIAKLAKDKIKKSKDKVIKDKTEINNLLKLLKVKDTPKAISSAELQKHLGDNYIHLKFESFFYHPIDLYPKRSIITDNGILVPIHERDVKKL